MTTPDEVCGEYLDIDLKFELTTTEDIVVFKGNAEALTFLARLFNAQAESDNDGFGISPTGAGSAWFAPGSTIGLYILRTGGENGDITD